MLHLGSQSHNLDVDCRLECYFSREWKKGRVKALACLALLPFVPHQNCIYNEPGQGLNLHDEKPQRPVGQNHHDHHGALKRREFQHFVAAPPLQFLN